MRLGVVSGVYLNYPIEEAVRRVAEAGYDSIDIWSGRPHIYRHDFSPNELKTLRRHIETSGLSVSSFLPAFYRYPYSLSSSNPAIGKDSIQYMKECMDNAVTLGSPILLIVPGRSLHGQSHEDAWKRQCDRIDEICRYAAQYTIRLGIEPVNRHVGDLVNVAKDAMRIIETLGHDNLGVVLDTGHMYLEQEAAETALAETGNRLLQFHVNDNDGQQQQNLVPGEGSYDFPGFVATLQQHGYTGTLSVELGYHYTSDPDSPVARSQKVLRNWIGTD